MNIKPELLSEYESYKAVNKGDPYSNAVVVYGEDWANLMEKEISSGKPLPEIAESTSRTADTDGITGFMYGCAVQALSKFWIHGETLRKWHNKEYGHEGEGVVNPAILTIVS